MDFGGLIRSIDWNWLETTLARVLAVLLCLTVHEACHGLAAYALGDPTARDRHRLSLNPLRHIDWLGLAMMLAVFLSRELYARGAWMPMGIRVSLFQFLLYTLAPLSIGLGLFNLLPIPPLDGSKVLGAFLPDRAFFGLMRYERYGMFLLLALSWFGVTGDLISGAIMKTYEGFFQLFY